MAVLASFVKNSTPTLSLLFIYVNKSGSIKPAIPLTLLPKAVAGSGTTVPKVLPSCSFGLVTLDAP